MRPEKKLATPASEPVAIPIVQTQEWVARGLYFDALALFVNAVTALALAIDLYAAGYLRATAGGAYAGVSFAPLARLGIEVLLFAASAAWIAVRLLRASYRELPRRE